MNDYLLLAIAVSLAYLSSVWLLSQLFSLIKKYRGSRSSDCRPGEMVHQGLKVTGRLWDQYRTAALLFGVTFTLLMYFGRPDIFSQRSGVLNVILVLCLMPPLVLGALKCAQLVRYRLRLGTFQCP